MPSSGAEIRCVHVLELAEQNTKHPSDREPATISHARSEIPKLQEEFRKAVPIESKLTLIAALFASAGVRTTAEMLRKDWGAFEKILHTTNQRHRNGRLSVKEQRVRLVATLDGRKDELLAYIANEVAGGAR